MVPTLAACTKIGATQRRRAWPVHKDDTHVPETVHILCNPRAPCHPLLANTNAHAKNIDQLDFIKM